MHTEVLEEVYELLFARYGPQHWWPAESRFEVMVGAVLTQNTNWLNVTKAVENLKANGYLSFSTMLAASHEEIAVCIRPSGYYNIKTVRLKNLLQMIVDRYDSEIEHLLADSTLAARENLLGVKGVGPETADAILLYGGNHPLFVVDAYTHRVFSRHDLIPEEIDYHDLQSEFMDGLPEDPALYNEYHALLVKVGKEYCKKKNPLCEHCPLQNLNRE